MKYPQKSHFSDFFEIISDLKNQIAYNEKLRVKLFH